MRLEVPGRGLTAEGCYIEPSSDRVASNLKACFDCLLCIGLGIMADKRADWSPRRTRFLVRSRSIDGIELAINVDVKRQVFH